MNGEIEMVECPVCHKRWPSDCQQATIMAKHNQCGCRYTNHSPEGMTLEKCEAELVEMFGPGNYFPKSESMGTRIAPFQHYAPAKDAPKPSCPLCDAGVPKRHVNVGILGGVPFGHRSIYGAAALLAGTQVHTDLERPIHHAVVLDTERMSEAERRALDGATRLRCVDGVVLAADGSKQSLEEAVRAVLASYPTLIVIDSISEGVEKQLVVKPTPAPPIQTEYVLQRDSAPDICEIVDNPPKPTQLPSKGKKSFEERQRDRHSLAAAAVLGMWGIMPHSRKPEKPKMKCLLPRCMVRHNHNGGYCSPEHCKEHNQMLKGKRV